MVKLRITKRKNGSESLWYKSAQGRVRVGSASQDWVKARDVMALGTYGIELQREQCAAGLGSDGMPMPALRPKYAPWKRKIGKSGIRDLYGPGKDGHMLDDIRVTYISDSECRYGITRKSSRDKARGNENRAPWWGWSPASVQKLAQRASEIFGMSTADFLISMGLATANAVSNAGRFLRRAA